MSAPAATERSVADEQLKMVLGHTRLGTLVATAFAIFLALQLRGIALPTTLIDTWLLVKLAVAGYRIFQGLRHERAELAANPDSSDNVCCIKYTNQGAPVKRDFRETKRLKGYPSTHDKG